MNHTSMSTSSILAQEPCVSDEERSLRILLAEDNHELGRLLSFVLRSEGYQVVEVHDGAQLLQTLAFSVVEGCGQRFDVVICEQGIPGISGLTVLACLRARASALPFILITASIDVQGQARQLGAVVLERPLTVEAVRGAVRQTETSRRALQSPRSFVLP